MVYIDLKYRADLTKPIPEQSISAPFVYGESQAHRFWVENIRSDLEGSVTGQFIRPDGNAVVLTDIGGFTGIENGKAWVVLASECYAFGGYARLIVNVTNGAQVTTVLNVRLTVGEAISGVQVDPGNAINLNLSDINTIVEMYNTVINFADAIKNIACRDPTTQDYLVLVERLETYKQSSATAQELTALAEKVETYKQNAAMNPIRVEVQLNSQTFSDTIIYADDRITSTMNVISSTISNSCAQGNDWSISTEDGAVRLTGKVIESTMLTLILQECR